MAQHTARRLATIALALAATTGIGTAVAATSHAADSASTTAAASTTGYHFSTRVVNQGEQAAIDACEGGLTLMPSVSDYVGRDYYPIHNECGGAPILNLVPGNTVHIDGVGNFTVVETQDVVRGDNASKIKDVAGDILLQTCHNSGQGMRVVGLIAVA